MIFECNAAPVSTPRKTLLAGRPGQGERFGISRSIALARPGLRHMGAAEMRHIAGC